jgi:hypothetical protein
MDDFRAELPGLGSNVTLDGCSRAVVALTWIFSRTTKASFLVLAQVNLTPDEVPRVDRYPAWHQRLGRDSDWTVYFESWETEARSAYDWYGTLVAEGTWAPPWRQSPLTNAVRLVARLNEPRWPSVVMVNKSAALPIIGTLEAATRANHLLTEEGSQLDLLDQSEREKLIASLRDNLGVDFGPIPEVLQSAHFLEPMPMLRSVSTRLDAPDDGPDRAVLLDIVPRRGRPIEKIVVEIFEDRSTGNRLLCRARPNTPFCRIPLVDDVEQIAIKVIHDDLGLLVEEGPHSFLRSVNIEMNLITRERRVPLPARKGRPSTTHRIPVGEIDRPIVVGGTDAVKSAAQVLRTVLLRTVHHRLTTGTGARDRQMWFRGDVVEAEKAIQKILATAKRSALVVDPYFSGDDVKVWLPSVTRRGAEIRVLTSSKGLQQIAIKESSAKGTSLEALHLERLRSEIATSERDRLVNPAAVRLMRGKPAIHDRFILADGRAWLLGSSLNEFGSRGTMLLALPAPAEVSAEIESVWRSEDASVGLGERIQELAADGK